MFIEHQKQIYKIKRKNLLNFKKNAIEVNHHKISTENNVMHFGVK